MKPVLISLLVFLLSFVSEGQAQTIPKTAEPERFDQRFEKPVLPKSSLEPLIPSQAEGLPSKQLEEIVFVLRGVVIEGATVYPEKTFHPFL